MVLDDATGSTMAPLQEVDEGLTKDRSIVFNAGTHWEAIRMDYSDFARPVQPKVFRFARG